VITFTQLGNYGRLGNQLFQYAALKSAALTTGYECRIPDPSSRVHHAQRCLLGEFNINTPFLTETHLSSLKYRFLEPSMNFCEELFSIEDNTDIFGHFQSVYYFQNHIEAIRKELTPKKTHQDFAEKYLERLRKDGSEVVSIHIRRGDVEYGPGSPDAYDETSLFGSYLERAVEHFHDKKVKYLVFTGGSRSGDDSRDIAWVKNHFEEEGETYVSETGDVMKDFTLMTRCDHNITCHGATFGWWAAFLNPNPEKIVIAPDEYFGAGTTHTQRPGYFPKSWVIK